MAETSLVKIVTSLENRVAQIQREISDRQRFRSAYAARGEEAFNDRSAFEEDRFRRYITPEDEQRQKDQAKNIGEISDNIRRLFGTGRR
jgi:regulator of replication initiation timing